MAKAKSFKIANSLDGMLTVIVPLLDKKYHCTTELSIEVGPDGFEYYQFIIRFDGFEQFEQVFTKSKGWLLDMINDDPSLFDRIEWAYQDMLLNAEDEFNSVENQDEEG